MENYKKPSDGIIFAIKVNNPSDYGVVDFDKDMKAKKIIEKPQNFISDYAIPGLYFYSNKVIEVAKNIKPSSRGELEITDVNKTYLDRNELYLEKMNREFAWLDTGTYDSLIAAGQFIHMIEKRQGLKVACLEEIAFSQGWIDSDQLISQANKFKSTSYGSYILNLLEKK